MKIEIYEMLKDYETGKKLGELQVRKNSSVKTRNKKVMEYLEKEYNITIRNYMITGNYTFGSQVFNGGYVLFGTDLPFRSIKILEV